MTMKRQVGFTLVEIALIMVIIGLLLGGVLKGKEIITNAKVKKLEDEYREITAAVYSYQYRYHALPGDDRYATKRFQLLNPNPQITTITNGNGNGRISGDFDDATEPPDKTKESRHLWAHLRLAELVQGEPGSTTLPSNPFGGVAGISYNVVSLDGRLALTIPGLFVGFTNIPNHIAIILESRSDDNQPHSGDIQTEEFDYTDNNKEHKIYLAF
jgi:type II secretory pathway pseudopilin PulG